MEMALSRNEKILALITVGLMAFFFLMWMQVGSPNRSLSQIESNTSINYQMARPEESFSEYSLADRSIDHTYETLAKKAQAQNKNSNKNISADELKKLVAKNVTPAKKTVAAQKATTPPSAQTKKEEKTAIASNAEAASSDVASDKNTKNEEPLLETSALDNADKNKADKNPQLPGQKNKNKKTYAQWRALLISQPTRENVALVVEAYKKNEITLDEYQALSQELVSQADPTVKGIGLLALRSVPSLQSFSQMVHIQNQLSTANQAYVEQAYLTYLQPQNIGVLNQALLTQDKTLILKSLNLLGINLQKYHQGDYTSFVDSRYRRDNGSSAISIATYRALLPALTTLSASQDQSLSALAQQVANLIQTSNNIAQN